MQSITAGTGLSGGTITSTGTLSVTNPYIVVNVSGGLSGGGLTPLGSTVMVSDTRFGSNTSMARAGSPSGVEKNLGEVWLVAGSQSGALPCAGQILSISENTALFSLLGTQYGGNGQTTFALPDLRGVAPNGLTYVICVSGSYPVMQ